MKKPIFTPHFFWVQNLSFLNLLLSIFLDVVLASDWNKLEGSS